MKELSVCVDESGDFGGYEIHSPYYIVTMVFHDQDIDITERIDKFNKDRDWDQFHTPVNLAKSIVTISKI